MPDRTRLNDTQIREGLKSLPGWSLDQETLRRSYRFPDFTRAWAFMTGGAIHAQAMNHHPNWSNVYDSVEISLSTHDAGGVTALDLELARRFEALAQRLLPADT